MRYVREQCRTLNHFKSMIFAHVDSMVLNNSTYYLQHPQVQQLRLVATYTTKIFS